MQHRPGLPAEGLKLRGAWCAGCALGYFVLQRLLGAAGRRALTAWQNGAGAGTGRAAYEAAYWTVTLLVCAMALALPLWAAARAGGLQPRRWLRRPGKRLLAPALVLYLGGSALMNLAAAAVGERTGSLQQLTLPQDGRALVLAFFAVCAVPAVGEELLFRGAAQSLLRPCGAWLAVTGQAVLFALLHWRLSAVVFALPAGLFFGYLTEQTGSLLPGMTLHFLNNTLAFVLLWMSRAGMETAAQALRGWLTVAFAAGAACLLLWLAGRHGRPFGRLAAGPCPLRLLQSPGWDLTAAFLAAAAIWNW